MMMERQREGWETTRENKTKDSILGSENCGIFKCKKKLTKTLKIPVEHSILVDWNGTPHHNICKAN